MNNYFGISANNLCEFVLIIRPVELTSYKYLDLVYSKSFKDNVKMDSTQVKDMTNAKIKSLYRSKSWKNSEAEKINYNVFGRALKP